MRVLNGENGVKSSRFVYVGACPDFDYDFVRYIIDHPSDREVTRSTFLRNADESTLPGKHLLHPKNKERGLYYFESYHKSRLPSGKVVYYIKWSGIEHFFVERPFSFKRERNEIKRQGSLNIKNYVKPLKEIAKKASEYYGSKIDWKILREPFKRGMAAWRTGHRPGANAFQWAYPRVYSVLLGGKAYFTSDADAAKKLPKKVRDKIESNAVWSDTKAKPETIVRDSEGNKIPERYLAGLSSSKRKERIKEIEARNKERKKMEKDGKLTETQKKKLGRPFKTDKYLKTKPSSYTVLARKVGIAVGEKK
jgi:hypothetical protein